MKITQIVTTLKKACGIAYFAKNLQEQLEKISIQTEIISELDLNCTSDILLLHYHSELFSSNELISFCDKSKVPVIIFAHSEGAEILQHKAKGFIGMCQGIFPETCKPNLIFPHPAWIPEKLAERTVLRERYKLPINKTIIGTNGFLKFERQFDEILNILLPVAEKNNWLIYILSSPWYLDSPSLIEKLEKYKVEYPNYFNYEHSYLEKEILNEKLQSFNLLWCWTKALSSPYASGVISDQYASGTRIFATDKKQHEHVLQLPNVAKGSVSLRLFIEQLISEIETNNFQRHSPEIISWENSVTQLIDFLLYLKNTTIK